MTSTKKKMNNFNGKINQQWKNPIKPSDLSPRQDTSEDVKGPMTQDAKTKTVNAI